MGVAGRPSDYSEELAERICLALIDGLSLAKICAEDDMPHRSTVLRWLERHPEFAARYARARESQADFMDDMILDVANASTPETAAADRVKIGAYQWRAAKLKPKKYGDRVLAEHTGPNGGPIQTVDLTNATDDDLARLEALLGPIASAAGGAASADQGGEGEEGAGG